MKIIHTADWHIGKIVNEFSMLEDQAHFFDQLIDRVKQLDADVLIMAGDLYDRSIPPREAVTLANNVLTRLTQEAGIPVLAIAGNHDSNERIEYGSELMEESKLYIEGTVKETVRKVTIKGVNFFLLPFADHVQVRKLFPNEDIRNIEDATRVQIRTIEETMDREEVNVLIMHGYAISGGQIDSVEVSDSERPLSIGTAEYIHSDLFEAFDYVALGHLHKAQKVGNDNIRYSGSPLKYSKSETNHKKQVTLVTLEKNSVSVEPLFFEPLRDMRVMKGTFSELMEQSSKDYVFFELEDAHTIMEAMNRLRKKFPYAMGLEYSRLQQRKGRETNQTREKMQKASLPALFEQYYQTYREHPLNEKQKNAIMNIYEMIGKEEDR